MFFYMITHTLSQVIFKPHIRINTKLTFNNLHNSASPIIWKVCVVPSPISIQILNSLFLIQGFLHLNLIENTDFFSLKFMWPLWLQFMPNNIFPIFIHPFIWNIVCLFILKLVFFEGWRQIHCPYKFNLLSLYHEYMSNNL